MRQTSKYFIFDMDGVLLDSMPLHIQAWHQAWQEFGIPITEQEIRELAGVPARETVAIVCYRYEKEYSESLAERITDRKIAVKQSLPEEKPFPEIYSILDSLKDCAVPLALVSGSRRSNIGRLVNKYFPSYFDFLIGADDCKSGKPHPEPFLCALGKWNQNGRSASAGNCLVVEDGIAGLRGARDAGMGTIALCTTLEKDELSAQSNIVVDNHEELLTYIKNEIMDHEDCRRN